VSCAALLLLSDPAGTKQQSVKQKRIVPTSDINFGIDIRGRFIK
jgi:hypothetical protein